MKKLIGPKKYFKLNTAVFISGTGSNLENLLKFSLLKESPIEVVYVISNNTKAKGLKFAKIYKIPFKIYKLINKEKDEKKILSDLKKKKINLICLAGFMKILSENFIKKFNGKILNIHPSLLPKYKGLNTHKRVLENNDDMTGCTVHYVNHELDGGEIIVQKTVKVNAIDSVTTLADKVLEQENLIYPEAIKMVLRK